MRPYLLLLLLHLQYVSNRELTNITLHEVLSTWNEAEGICRSFGQTLLSLETTDKYVHVIVQLMTGKWKSYKTDTIWIGLHNQPDSASNNQIWTSTCKVGNMPYWENGHENFLPSKPCVYIKLDQATEELVAFKSKCSVDTKYFMCQSSSGDCYYEVELYVKGEGVSSSTFLEPASRQKCQQKCLIHRETDGTPCIGFNYRISTNRCRFLVSNNVYENDELYRGSGSHELHKLRCGIYPLEEDDPLYTTGSWIPSVNFPCLTPKSYSSVTSPNLMDDSSLSVAKTIFPDVSTSPVLQTSEFISPTPIPAWPSVTWIQSTVEPEASETTDIGNSLESPSLCPTFILTIVTTTTVYDTASPDNLQCTGSSSSEPPSISPDYNIDDIIKIMKIDKKNTSLSRRKLYSAPDKRTSSKAIGLVAAIFLGFTTFGIIFMDVTRIHGHKQSKIIRLRIRH